MLKNNKYSNEMILPQKIKYLLSYCGVKFLIGALIIGFTLFLLIPVIAKNKYNVHCLVLNDMANFKIVERIEEYFPDYFADKKYNIKVDNIYEFVFVEEEGINWPTDPAHFKFLTLSMTKEADVVIADYNTMLWAVYAEFITPIESILPAELFEELKPYFVYAVFQGQEKSDEIAYGLDISETEMYKGCSLNYEKAILFIPAVTKQPEAGIDFIKYCFNSCQKNNNTEQLTNYMSSVERNSIVLSELSNKQKYYHEVADVAEYIQEMSIYDEELEKTYIIHITLPPDYDKDKFYPMYMMTDGIWRLSDHGELRPMMVNGEIEDIIMVSIGYNYGIDGEKMETRFVEFVSGCEDFLNFITDNLAPYLGEQYNIDFHRSALMGHSLGGLFMYYAVFNHDKYINQPFNYYVMASPSFFLTNTSHWRYGDIVKEYFNRNSKLTKQIYLTAGNNEEYTDILQDIESFLQRAKKNRIKTIEYELFNGNHTSFVKPMMRKSLLMFYNKG